MFNMLDECNSLRLLNVVPFIKEGEDVIELIRIKEL
jgi:hypothetical protein